MSINMRMKEILAGAAFILVSIVSVAVIHDGTAALVGVPLGVMLLAGKGMPIDE